MTALVQGKVSCYLGPLGAKRGPHDQLTFHIEYQSQNFTFLLRITFKFALDS